MKYWSGTKIDKLEENEIFVYGSNPQGINGAGAAKAAMSLSKGAKYGVGRGFNGSNAYALVTKSLNAGFLEKSTGITYETEGYRSVSTEQIRANIDELYECAKSNPDKDFIISYQFETWPNGSPKKSLNGYTSREILDMFIREDIPSNIVFHDSYKSIIEASMKTEVKKIENKTEGYTFFFTATNAFSQWHPSKFEFRDFEFICAEQFMMFSKAKTFKDDVVADKIMKIENNFIQPDNTFKTKQDEACYNLVQDFRSGRVSRQEAVNNANLDNWKAIQAVIKKLGREVSNYSDEVWSKKRVNVVAVASREKYNQNQDLKDMLLATGNTLMVEASKFDKIWGIGLYEYDAKKTDPSKWPGLNLLGHILTDLRNTFNNELKASPKMKV